MLSDALTGAPNTPIPQSIAAMRARVVAPFFMLEIIPFSELLFTCELGKSSGAHVRVVDAPLRADDAPVREGSPRNRNLWYNLICFSGKPPRGTRRQGAPPRNNDAIGLGPGDDDEN